MKSDFKIQPGSVCETIISIHHLPLMRNAKSIHAPIQGRKLLDRFFSYPGKIFRPTNPTILCSSHKNERCGAWKLIWQRIHGMWRQPDQQQYTVFHAGTCKVFLSLQKHGLFGLGLDGPPCPGLGEERADHQKS